MGNNDNNLDLNNNNNNNNDLLDGEKKGPHLGGLQTVVKSIITEAVEPISAKVDGLEAKLATAGAGVDIDKEIKPLAAKIEDISTKVGSGAGLEDAVGRQGFFCRSRSLGKEGDNNNDEGEAEEEEEEEEEEEGGNNNNAEEEE